MSDPKMCDSHDNAALMKELVETTIEEHPRSIFERRALIEQALVTIRRWRANQRYDAVFDGDRSALRKVEDIHSSIASAADHHVRAALLIAAEFIDMLQPAPVSPLGKALRKRSGAGIETGDTNGEPKP